MALYNNNFCCISCWTLLLEDFPRTTVREYFSYSLSTASCAAAFPTGVLHEKKAVPSFNIYEQSKMSENKISPREKKLVSGSCTRSETGCLNSTVLSIVTDWRSALFAFIWEMLSPWERLLTASQSSTPQDSAHTDAAPNPLSASWI